MKNRSTLTPLINSARHHSRENCQARRATNILSRPDPGDVTPAMHFIANRRLNQIGLAEQYPGASNPFPWMSEMMDLRKEKHFFETRVIEYQTGGALSWD